MDQVFPFPNRGASVIYSIEPYPERLAITRRTLIVAPHDPEVVKDNPQYQAKGMDWNTYNVTAKKTLVTILGEFCRYPKGYLHGPAERLLEFLVATNRLNLFTNYGAMRKTKKYF
ncbi:MAG: hypothetical protein KDA84_17725, partial [Planctomycetaceae bacterium]|nr:hypothetical protein [Planctomycetaceae bacterium]